MGWGILILVLLVVVGIVVYVGEGVLGILELVFEIIGSMFD